MDSSKITKPKKVEIKSNFVMSNAQVKILCLILKNIRQLLNSYNLQGNWVLQEIEGDTYLSSRLGTCVIKTNNTIQLSGGLAGLDKEMLREFITDTIRLLKDKIPFGVKRIRFTVTNRDFSIGRFKCNKENSSIELELF